MTKSKGSIAEETKKKILASAQVVFLENKFNEASLRQICKNAGVTTGALYCFYKDKNALFEELLSPFITQFFSILEGHFNMEESSKVKEEAVSREFAMQFISLQEEYKEACAIFLKNLEHPYCQTMQEQCITMFSNQTKALLTRVDIPDIPEYIFNDNTIYWFSHMQVDMLFQVLRHALPKEEAIAQMLIYTRFLKGGFLELVAPRFSN